MGPVQTVIHMLRAGFALTFFVVTGLMINTAEALTLVLLPFSLKTYRIANKILVGIHWPILVWFIEKWANVSIKMYGDPVPAGETALGLLNHKSDIDWVIGFAFCGRKCILGALKVIVKTGHKMIPIFGVMEQFVEFIFVNRDWQRDRHSLDMGLKNLATYPKPFWFIVFPEGTRFTQAKKQDNQEWSKENGKPVLNHLLWPRTKAFLMTVELLGETIDFVYDATIVFDKDVSFFDMLKGNGNTSVHFHVRRFPMAALSKMSHSELEAWLEQQWVEKDALLETYHTHGSYKLPENIAERPMRSEIYVYSWLVLLASLAVTAYMLMPSSVWFWLQVGLAFLMLFIAVGVVFLQSQLSPSAKGTKGGSQKAKKAQ
mmetsp:Transcript_40706/g.100026  ORF Transcript_40706/g.100026 Transcript_40706/m.100026 type:complete len:373 (+) Transcript_40706:341-1459(+)